MFLKARRHLLKRKGPFLSVDSSLEMFADGIDMAFSLIRQLDIESGLMEVVHL
ncbi:MAG TPA: hypothetical protein VEB01_02630 [Methylocaldum sp.]|nr:hypothetical protein [Methylocaldum sp.]HYE34305.1 hypothetical protein [Methylocaldum sp.]